MVNLAALSDSELTDLLKSGNHPAFAEIFKRYAPVLYSTAYRKVYDEHLAEDFVQNVMVDLWEKRKQYSFTHGLEAFLFTAIRNQYLNYFKKEKVSQRYIGYLTKSFNEEVRPADYLVRYNDLDARIAEEIAALPEKMRVIYQMRKKEFLHPNEIAKKMSIPENTVNDNIQRANKILKARLRDSFVLVLSSSCLSANAIHGGSSINHPCNTLEKGPLACQSFNPATPLFELNQVNF